MRLVAILLTILMINSVSNADEGRPNVLFIAVDDLNDWIGCLGGHPQARTPNIDRLAASGVLFTNAHCAAPACNPSRTAIMTGISPHRSGMYDNRQQMREVLPDAELLPKYFTRHGSGQRARGRFCITSSMPRRGTNTSRRKKQKTRFLARCIPTSGR